MLGKLKEFIRIFRVIRSARRCEEFLWGIYNDDWGLEEWQRMITKRAHKIVKIDTKNPHWKIELQKRLLQNACVSISLMGRIKNLKDGIHPTVESNLKYIHPIMARCKAKDENKPEMKVFTIYSVYPSEDDIGSDEWGFEVVLNDIILVKYGDDYHDSGSDKALGFIDGYAYAESMRKGIHYIIKHDNKIDENL